MTFISPTAIISLSAILTPVSEAVSVTSTVPATPAPDNAPAIPTPVEDTPCLAIADISASLANIFVFPISTFTFLSIKLVSEATPIPAAPAIAAVPTIPEEFI